MQESKTVNTKIIFRAGEIKRKKTVESVFTKIDYIEFESLSEENAYETEIDGNAVIVAYAPITRDVIGIYYVKGGFGTKNDSRIFDADEVFYSEEDPFYPYD